MKGLKHMFLIVVSTVVAIGMATLMIFVRMKAAERPTSVKRIIIPPLMMSTGCFMFIFPEFRLSAIQTIEAVTVGIIFSILLIKSSTMRIEKGHIYLSPSKYFIFILFGLLGLRVIFKLIIGSYISFGETSGMFFILALAMIFTWRLSMLIQFKRLEKQLK